MLVTLTDKFGLIPTLKIILLVLSALIQTVAQGEATNSIAKAQARQKADYERQHEKQLPLIKVGQKVHLKMADRKGDKSDFPFSGPYTVIEVYTRMVLWLAWLQKEGKD